MQKLRSSDLRGKEGARRKGRVRRRWTEMESKMVTQEGMMPGGRTRMS